MIFEYALTLFGIEAANYWLPSEPWVEELAPSLGSLDWVVW